MDLFNGATLAFTNGNVTTARTYFLGTSTLAPASGGSIEYTGATLNDGTLGAGKQILATGTTLNGTRTTTGTVLSQNGGTITFNNVTLSGSGTFTQAAGATLNSTNDFTANPQTTTILNGTANLTGGYLSGALTVSNGATINESGSTTPLYFNGSRGTAINAGGEIAALNGSTIELGGLLVNNGTQAGLLDINQSGVAEGTGTYGTVNVGSGGQFGVGAVATGTSANAAAALPVLRLATPGGLAATAFVGPRLATTNVTPGVANLTSLALGSNSVFAFHVQDAQGAAGAGYDTVRATGGLTLSAGTTPGNQITVGVASLDAAGASGAAANFDATQNYQFVLVEADGGITGFTAGEFVVDASNFQNATNGGSFSVVQAGNELVLDFNAVPEPSTWAMLAAGGMLLAVSVRRRSAA